MHPSNMSPGPSSLPNPKPSVEQLKPRSERRAAFRQSRLGLKPPGEPPSAAGSTRPQATSAR